VTDEARSAPPAPWTVTCDAVLWVTRPRRSAVHVLHPLLRGSRVAAVVGGVVRYSATPVGPYAEVFGAVGGLQGVGLWGSVPFMAVDSSASLAAGRVNWGLPKTPGAVEGSPGIGTVTARSVDGPQWRITATPRPFGPAVRVPGRATLRQVADGAVLSSPVGATGSLRPATVRVAVESDGPLTEWLRPGRHPGAVATGVQMTIAPPR